MEDAETSQIEAQPFSLLDVSASDDDFLLTSSSEVCSMLDTKANVVNNQDGINEVGAHMKQSNATVLQRPKKNGKCNLRKSLAWDSAFFTSAGVLEPEELSSIMEGAEASVKKKHMLPGIQEDLSKSTDSISTFESDLTLESLEADLFSDIRASIQRCSKTQEKREDSKIYGGESTNGHSSKIAEKSSGNMVKPKFSSKKLNSVLQPPHKPLKPGSGCKQVTKPVVKSRESSSSLSRRHEVASKPGLTGATATKRMSVNTGHTKSESNFIGNLKAGKTTPIAKAPNQTESSASKKLAASSFSSSSSVFYKTTMRSSRSSCDSSSSSSAGTNNKSQSDVRRKMEKNTNQSLGSITRTASRVLVKGKSQTGQSNLSHHLKSKTKLSSSISPASSISEWSMESCSSTATVEQKHIELNSSSYSSTDNNVDKCVSKDSGSDPNFELFSSQCAVQASTGTNVSLPHPGFAKPSGLRLPSAKIGFFDGIKAGSKTPSTSSRSRSGLPSSLPRPAAGVCTPRSGKTKLTNTSKVNPIVSGRTAKPELTKTDVNIKLDVHTEDSTVLQKDSNVEGVDVMSDIPHKLLENGSHKLVVGEIGKVDEVDEKKQVANPVLGVGEGSHPQMNKANLEGELNSTYQKASFVPVDGFIISDISNQLKDSSLSPSTRTGQKQNDGIINVDSKSMGHGATDEKAPESQLKMNKEGDYDSESKSLNNNEMSFCSTNPTCPKHWCDDKKMESAHSAGLNPCSLPLFCSGASPVTRTPFTVKNSGSDMIETSDSSLHSAVDALVKVDAMPPLEEAHKENI